MKSPPTQPRPSHHPRQARDPARPGLGSPTQALQPRRWCKGRQRSPTRQQEAKAGTLLQGKVPGKMKREAPSLTRPRPCPQLRSQTQLPRPRAAKPHLRHRPPTIPVPRLSHSSAECGGLLTWGTANGQRRSGTSAPGGRVAGGELRVSGRGGYGAALGPAVVASQLLRRACGAAAVTRQIRAAQCTGRTARGRWRRDRGQGQGQP